MFFVSEQVKANFSKQKLPSKLIHAIQTLERDMKYMSKLTTKTQERQHGLHSGAFIFNSEHCLYS